MSVCVLTFVNLQLYLCLDFSVDFNSGKVTFHELWYNVFAWTVIVFYTQMLKQGKAEMSHVLD